MVGTDFWGNQFLITLEKKITYNPTGSDVSGLYQDNGYLFSNIQPIEVGIVNDSVDIEMRVYEGAQATINKILIKGNDRTSDHVIRRELRTIPGQKYNRSELIRTQRELSQLGYFDPENINPIPVPNPIPIPFCPRPQGRLGRRDSGIQGFLFQFLFLFL